MDQEANTMTRYITVFAAAALLFFGYSRMTSATTPSDVVGTWVFHVAVNGASPCECIQILTLHPDFNLEGLGNDQFIGQARGIWSKTNANKVRFVLVQNSFNHDGTALGLYTIQGTMSVNGPSTGAGTATFTVTDNSGKELEKGGCDLHGE
jgi:hypothetical protein